MIGLVDWDLQTSNSMSALLPNLEIMKLSTYYRKEKNVFCRLVDLDETELTGYDKIYFFSELNAVPDIPPAFKAANNVIYGGSAFTDRKYLPFANDIIDFTLPSPVIYKEFLKQKYNDGIKYKVIEHTLDDTYYRMFAGDKKLPIPPVRPKKRVWIYDRDFLHDGWDKILNKIVDRRPALITPVHPIFCHRLSEFFALRAVPKFSRSANFILDLNIPMDEVGYMLKHYTNQFLGDIVETSNVNLSLGNDYVSSFQYYKDFIYKINLLFSFWSKGIKIKIYYNEPRSYSHNPIENLERAIAQWTHTAARDIKTIDEKIKTAPVKMRPILSEEKKLLLKFHPEAKDLFTHNFTEIKERRYWRI